jgi:hypothetical protein
MSDTDIKLTKLAYSTAELARAVGVSVDLVQSAMRDGSLMPSYVRSKPIFPINEAERWLSSLPTEKP